MAAKSEALHELTIEREIAAPREIVFAVWTDARHLAQWWGPRDFDATIDTADIRPGGKYRIRIHRANGEGYWMRGTYRTIEAPERIVMTFAWEHDEPARENLITVTFADRGDRTLLTFHQAPFPDAAERDSHRSGWSELLERFAAHAESRR